MMPRRTPSAAGSWHNGFLRPRPTSAGRFLPRKNRLTLGIFSGIYCLAGSTSRPFLLCAACEKKIDFGGVVVQLVRTPACHAGGREFESRRPRQITEALQPEAAGPLSLIRAKRYARGNDKGAKRNPSPRPQHTIYVLRSDRLEPVAAAAAPATAAAATTITAAATKATAASRPVLTRLGLAHL